MSSEVIDLCDSSPDGSDDEDLQRALAASLRESTNTRNSNPAPKVKVKREGRRVKMEFTFPRGLNNHGR